MRDALVLAWDEEYDDSLEIKFLGEEEKVEIRKYYTREIHRQSAFKFLLMGIRTKISYHSFKRRMTINEYILKTILSSYTQLLKSGSIPAIAPYSNVLLKRFDEMLNNPQDSAIIDL
jgi:hypothetical protein